MTIRLPEPEIPSVSLDEQATGVYDRYFGPLNLRPDDELVEQTRAAAVERVEEIARGEDILDQAEQNAEDSIRPSSPAWASKKCASSRIVGWLGSRPYRSGS